LRSVPMLKSPASGSPSAGNVVGTGGGAAWAAAGSGTAPASTEIAQAIAPKRCLDERRRSAAVRPEGADSKASRRGVKPPAPGVAVEWQPALMDALAMMPQPHCHSVSLECRIR